MADVTPCPLCIAEGEQRPGPVRYRGLCGKHLARERRSGTAAAPTREYVRGGTWCTAPHPAGPVKAKARGLCASHYMMARRGEPVLGALKPPGAASCVGPSSDEAVRCGRPVHGGDLCQGHYWQKRAGRDLTPIRERHSPGGTCSACKMQGDDREAVNAGLCYSHYDRKRMMSPTGTGRSRRRRRTAQATSTRTGIASSGLTAGPYVSTYTSWHNTLAGACTSARRSTT